MPCEIMTPAPRALGGRTVAPLAVAAEVGGIPGCEEDPCECVLQDKVSVFWGWTAARGGGGGPTLGIDYLHRFTRNWGVGAFAEHVRGETDAYVCGIGVDWHPCESVVVFVGPGLEYEDEEWDPILRIGGGVEVEIYGGWAFGPVGYFDIRGPKGGDLVLGVNIGKAF